MLVSFREPIGAVTITEMTPLGRKTNSLIRTARAAARWVIVLVDQTSVNGVEVVNAAIPFQGRAVPVAWVDFEYSWQKVEPPSQNTIERYLFTWLQLAVPRGARLILIFDRGYAACS